MMTTPTSSAERPTAPESPPPPKPKPPLRPKDSFTAISEHDRREAAKQARESATPPQDKAAAGVAGAASAQIQMERATVSDEAVLRDIAGGSVPAPDGFQVATGKVIAEATVAERGTPDFAEQVARNVAADIADVFDTPDTLNKAIDEAVKAGKMNQEDVSAQEAKVKAELNGDPRADNAHRVKQEAFARVLADKGMDTVRQQIAGTKPAEPATATSSTASPEGTKTTTKKEKKREEMTQEERDKADLTEGAKHKKDAEAAIAEIKTEAEAVGRTRRAIMLSKLSPDELDQLANSYRKGDEEVPRDIQEELAFRAAQEQQTDPAVRQKAQTERDESMRVLHETAVSNFNKKVDSLKTKYPKIPNFLELFREATNIRTIDDWEKRFEQRVNERDTNRGEGLLLLWELFKLFVIDIGGAGAMDIGAGALGGPQG